MNVYLFTTNMICTCLRSYYLEKRNFASRMANSWIGNVAVAYAYILIGSGNVHGSGIQNRKVIMREKFKNFQVECPFARVCYLRVIHYITKNTW